MSVRAKMSPQGNTGRGEKGSEIYLGAVYENNAKLRRLSENAIFGDSTPSGSLSLAGDLPIEKFASAWSHEYYIDMCEPGNAPRENALVSFKVRKVYQSAPSSSDGGVSYRFAVLMPLSGDLRMLVKNPHANTWLCDHDEMMVFVSEAYGRQTDEVIAILREDLAEYAADAHATGIKFHKMADGSPELDRYVLGCTEGRRRRLWMACGGRGEYTEGAEKFAETVEALARGAP